MRRALAAGSLVLGGTLVGGCADLLGFKTFIQDRADGGGLGDSGAPSTQGDGNEGGAGEACGADGCGAGRKCENGFCVCDPATCAGCCSGSACSTGWPGCGAGGGACNACDDKSDRCDPSGACACGSGAACSVGQKCNGGGCRCDATTCVGGTCCGDTCVKTDGDGANCGACGHSCLGATCSGGLCAPATVASTGQNAWAIARAGARLFWLSADGLYGSPTTGTDATSFGPVATAFGPTSTDLVAYWDNGTDSHVFASGYNTSTSSPTSYTTKPDGSAVTTFQSLEVRDGWFLDADGEFYWFGGGDISRRGFLNKLVIIIMSGLSNASAIAADANNLYVTDTQKLWACPRAKVQCGTDLTLISATNSPAILATAPDSQHVYYSNSKGIYRCPYLGCPDPNNAPIWTGGQQRIQAMVADDKFVYWTDAGAGTVMKCAHGDVCVQATVVASGLNQPWGIALDDQWVYYTLASGTGATVQRIAK